MQLRYISAFALLLSLISLNPHSWTLYYWTGKTSHPSSCGLAICIDIPSDRYIDYEIASTPKNTVIAGRFNLRITLLTTGAPIFDWMSEPYNTCPTPARIHPYFETPDNGSIPYEFTRWWANPTSYEFASGQTLTYDASGQPITYTIPWNSEVLLSIPLDNPSLWSSINGKFGDFDSNSQTSFSYAKAHVSAIGFTTGGGCFFGHGVKNVGSGTAKIQVSEVSAQ